MNQPLIRRCSGLNAQTVHSFHVCSFTLPLFTLWWKLPITHTTHILLPAAGSSFCSHATRTHAYLHLYALPVRCYSWPQKGSEERKGNDGPVSPASALWCCTLTQLSKNCLRAHSFVLSGWVCFFSLWTENSCVKAKVPHHNRAHGVLRTRAAAACACLVVVAAPGPNNQSRNNQQRSRPNHRWWRDMFAVLRFPSISMCFSLLSRTRELDAWSQGASFVGVRLIWCSTISYLVLFLL